ncbi:hypothetical protein [Halalkalibacter flavus]|uniref:hypothetical protein n=1 Tax=Halalkalibacter flavus TaxID=3090668 RepID=UPI002FCBDD80
MQAKNLKGGQPEPLCINTEKVYDWLINEATFNLSLDDVDLPEVNGEQLLCEDIENVTCSVEPGEAVILSREDQSFIINGDEQPVELQVVTIQKSFEVTVFVTTTTGQTVSAGTFPFTRREQVVLCAPEGTSVTVNYIDVSCFVEQFNCAGTEDEEDEETTIDLGVVVRLCQSIQSTFPVTLELMAEFCQPRDVVSLPSPFAPECPDPVIPPQCPVLFPNNGDDD